MSKLARIARKLALVIALGAVALSGGGCELVSGFAVVTYDYCLFWECLPFWPVSPYWSQKIEDEYWEEERYDRVPVLDPVEGENAPLFCLDPPTPDEVVRALPNHLGVDGGFAFIAETTANNVRITTDLLVDHVGECRFYPLVGPARPHKCHYKCTVYYDKWIRSFWPVPFEHMDESVEVVYIDHDHLIRCAGPETPQ